jgi:hypothetical protein
VKPVRRWKKLPTSIAAAIILAAKEKFGREISGPPFVGGISSFATQPAGRNARNTPDNDMDESERYSRFGPEFLFCVTVEWYRYRRKGRYVLYPWTSNSDP